MMKKNTSLLRRICSLMLTLIMVGSTLYGNPMIVHADRDDGMECWSCGHYHWDEYCCGTCGACSPECTNSDCFVENHCNECGACKNEDAMFCDECRHCSDCCYDNGWHCLLCEGCYYTDESALCGHCWLCEDCRGGLCDTCGFCAECYSSENDNMHCPECDNCYSAVDQCPNENNNHCVECCVFCEQCDECLFEDGLELCEDCGLCTDCCEMAAQEQDCSCGEYCVESPEWYEHLCMDCGTPYCNAEQCDNCGLCADCCAAVSECEDDPPMCAEDTEYADHFCEDCGTCFHVEDPCDTCGSAGEIRCVKCCEILTKDAGCDCSGYCLNESGFEEHVMGYHGGDTTGSHDPTPKSEWVYDRDGHWHDCRYCIEHGQLDYNPHNLNKYGVCVNCGFDSYAKIVFLKQPKSKTVQVTDVHNAGKGDPLNVEDNQVSFSVASMDQTGNTDFSYQWYQRMGTEGTWNALEDYTNYWTDPNVDSFSMVSGSQKKTLKLSVPSDVCCETYYYKCVVSTNIDGEKVTAESAVAAIRSPHIYKGKYYPIVGNELKHIIAQPNREDNIGVYETSIHDIACVGEGCEEYKSEGHHYSKETKSYIDKGTNIYGDPMGDGAEWIEYTCMDCGAKRYVKAHEHYFYDPETDDYEVDYNYENSINHQLKCLHDGCEKTTREPHTFMAWQMTDRPQTAVDGIGRVYKECQFCGYQYTKKPTRYDPETDKNVSTDWTMENDLIYVQYGSASSDIFQRGDELLITFSPTEYDKKDLIQMENPVCTGWSVYYDQDPSDPSDALLNVSSDFTYPERVSGQPKWKIMLKDTPEAAERIDQWYTGGGILSFEPDIGDQECQHNNGTRIAGAYDPVCIYEGYTGDEVCADCGAVVEYGENIPGGDKHTGELVLKPSTPREATCNTRGYEGTYICSECHKPVPGKYTPRVHQDTYVTGYVAPSCSEFGYSGNAYCEGCHELIKEGTLLAPEHQNVHIEGYVAPTKEKNGYSGDLVCDDCDLTIKYGYTIYTDRVISEVAIEDVAWPVTGETPDYDVTIDPKAKYEIDSFSAEHVKKGISWTVVGSEERFYPNETFNRGDTYRFRAVLTKRSTYAFADDLTATVNGQIADAYQSNDGKSLIVEYEFTYTKSPVVSEIAIQIPEPVPGALSTYDMEYNRELLSIDEFGIDDDDGFDIEYDRFEEGKVYTYFFQFVPLVDGILTGGKEACTFANEVTVTVNGKQVPAEEIHVEQPDPNNYDDYGAVWFRYEFSLKPPCEHTKWHAATCTTPKTCSACGETEGTALGHKLTASVIGGTTYYVCSTCKKAYKDQAGTMETVLPAKVPSTGVVLNVSSCSVAVGKTYTLKASMTPAASTDKLTWSSSNAKIAKVSDTGVVTGVAKGTATITVKTTSGKTATCSVTVNIPATSVTLNSTSLELNVGKSSTLKATLGPKGTTDTITWSSSNNSIATVSSKGAVKAVGKGTATITAKASSGKTATCKVTVMVPATAVSLNTTKHTMNTGTTYALKATMTPGTSTDKITWTSSSTKIATVSADGVVKAIGKGTATITAKTTSGKKATCKVTVNVPATGVTLNAASLDLNVGKTGNLKTTLSPKGCTDTVTWSSSNNSVATVDAKGTVKAIGKGTATITAKTGSGKTAICSVTVRVPATAVKLDVTACSLNAGKTLPLKATMSPNTSTDTITWSSSNTKIATVSADGIVKAIDKGTATITAKTGSGKKATCKVTVTVPATGVTLNTTTYTLNAGKSYTLKAAMSPKTATDTVTWTSSNNSVATVSNKGAVKGIAAGTAVITAKTGSGKTASCTIKVMVPAKSVKLSESKYTMNAGAKHTLKATMNPTGTTDTITWTSSDTKIATVSNAGVVTAIGKGTATVTAKTTSGKKATCKITVKVPVISMTLDKTTLELVKGKSYTLKATTNPAATTDKLTWSSSDKKIATVSNKGVVKGVKAGTAMITVKADSGVIATCKVTVK